MAQDIMTTEEAARYLRLGPDTLKRRARAGQVPAAKTGRKWVFRKVDLDAWLARGGLLPERLVDQWLVESSEEILRNTREDEWLSAEQVKAELGL